MEESGVSPEAAKQTSASSPDPLVWLAEHGDVLYRYALARVRRPEVAEDLLQETFVAALRSKDGFQGKSSERTWLTGILRHKIMDYFRSRSRGLPEAQQMSHEDALNEFFDERGRWIEPPQAAAVRPDALLEQEDFWAVFDECLDTLSPRQREAFVRRAMEGEDTSTVCKALKITATNFWVMMYRARTQMRRCLMLKWFQGGDSKGQKET